MDDAVSGGDQLVPRKGACEPAKQSRKHVCMGRAIRQVLFNERSTFAVLRRESTW
jgi:hypothetical protein